LARENGIALKVGNFTLDDVHASEEAFVTGTFGGLTPVREIDGYTMPLSLPGPVTAKLRTLYAALKDKDAANG
jgi:branched-chain amino acid aminotransferase